MRLSRLIPAGLGLLLILTAARTGTAQTFQGIIGLTTPNGPIEASVKNGKARFTTQTPMGPAGIIMDPAASELYIIVDAQKMVMVVKLNRDSTATSGDSTVVTPLAKRDTIAGHECRVFRFVSPKSATDICIASGLGNLGAAGLFGGGMRPGRPAALPAWTTALGQQGGFPLRVADTTGAVQYQVTKIEPKPLDDSLFVPPADYQRMQMPSFGRPPGDRGA